MSDTFFNSTDGIPQITVQDVSQNTIVNNVTTLTYPDGSVSDAGGGIVNLNTLPGGTGIDGANIGTYNAYLKSVWTMNDVGGPMDDSFGSFDLSVNGSPTFATTGKNVNAMQFNTPYTDYLTRPAGFGATDQQSFSINIWFYPTDLSVNRTLWEFYGDSLSYTALHVNATNMILYGYENNNYFVQDTIVAHGGVLNAWNMATVTFHNNLSGVDTTTLYLNGVQIASDARTAALGGMPVDAWTFYIARSQRFGYGFAGKIDETQMWVGSGTDPVLSPNAVSDLWNGGNGLFLT